MKRFLLFSSIVFALLASADAQTRDKNSSLINSVSTIPVPCNSAFKGLRYGYSNPMKLFLCNGTSWVDISSGGKQPVKSVDIKIDRNKKFDDISSKTVLPTKNVIQVIENTSETGETGRRYRGTAVNIGKIAYYNSALNGFHVISNHFFPRAKVRIGQRFSLSGAASIGYNNSNSKTDPLNANAVNFNPFESKSNELSLGLDLHLGTYILDPRFIKLSADLSFARDKGSFDEFETRNGIRGLGFAVDFLPGNSYPFRFRYVKQDSNFLGRMGATTNTARSVLGFNWQLRKPNLPVLVVNYDKVSYDSRLLASSFFKTDGQALTVTATDTFKGWNLNSNYNFQTSAEELTTIKSRQNFFQVNGRKEFSQKLDLFIGSFYQNLRFSNDITESEQNSSFFDVHSFLNYRPTDKLTASFSHQFYYNSNDTKNLFTVSNPAASSDTTSFFNSFGSQLTYRVHPDLTVGATTTANLINPPNDIFESTTQLLDVAATISWRKKIKSGYLRASALEGIAYAKSNFGNNRNIGFRRLNGGITFGEVQSMLLSADYNYSYRPDIYQSGGHFTENNYSVNITTEALNPFRLRASVGSSDVEYLTSRGREKFDRMFYSAGVEHRLFSLQFARNENDGVRDIFTTGSPIPNHQMFIVLPTDSLIRNPFLDTKGKYTSAMLRIQPRRDLNFEFRYLDDRSSFVFTNDVNIKQFDAIATYRLGKFIFTGGLSRQQQMTQDLFSRYRNYVFIRATRRFTIF